MKRALLFIALLAVLIGCGARHQTEKMMLEWGAAFNFHLATGGTDGDYSYPKSLAKLAPDLNTDLSETDGWGNKFVYRRIRDDRYQLISVGPDGELGNEDDVVLENAAFYDPLKAYKKFPL